MKKSIIYFVLILLLVGCGATTQKTYMGYKVFDVSYPVVNNQILTFAVTDAGPIPAENDLYKIEVVGLNVFPSKEDIKKAVFTWSFVFTVKNSQKIESVQIEEISSSDVAKMVLIDTNPTMKNNQWIKATPPEEITPQSVQWLYNEKASVYVYRFTIKPVNAEAVVMNQLVWYSKPAKKSLQYTIEKINNR